jgi:hypothetical protein
MTVRGKKGVLIMTVAIHEELIQTMDRIVDGNDPTSKLRTLLEEAIRHRLAGYELTDLRFQKKYDMTLEEFEAQNMLQKLGYSFEVESDYHDWDMAIDGIRFLNQDFGKLKSVFGRISGGGSRNYQ